MEGCGYSSEVERQLPKLSVGGSNPLTRSLLLLLLLSGCVFPTVEESEEKRQTGSDAEQVDMRSKPSTEVTRRPLLRKAERPPVGFKAYRIKAGDTLSTIAEKHGISVRLLKKINNLLSDDIYEGETIFVPCDDVPGFIKDESFAYPVKGRAVGYFNSIVDGAPCLGVEFAVKYGTEVRASRTGVVVYISKRLPGYGGLVIVRHGRYRTLYGFLSEIYVRVGSRVRKGEIIGRSGRSPYSKKERLRFRIYDGDTSINPLLFLK